MRREVIYDAEHFFDGFKRNPDYALRTIQAAADAGRGLDRPVRHQRRRLARGGRRGRRAGRPRGRAFRWAFTPTTTATLPWPMPWRRSATGRARSRGRSTAWASGAATSTCAAWSANLALKYPGYEVLSPGKLEHLTELSRYVYETANMNFRPNQPFVGTSAFAHKGGMHVHGVRKNAASYEHIDPATVGNERRVLVSELSGKSNIAEKLSEYGLEQDGDLLARVLDRVQDLENEGYQFEAAEASFVLLVERLAGRHRPGFDVAGASTSASAASPAHEAPTSTEATDQAQGRRRGSSTRSARGTDRSMPWTAPCERPWKGTSRGSRR